MPMLENKVSELESKVGIISVKIDTVNNSVADLNGTVKKLTELIATMVLLQERQSNLQKDHEMLQKDYYEEKEKNSNFRTMIKTAVSILAIVFGSVQGIGHYIFNKEIERVSTNSSRIRNIEQILIQKQLAEPDNVK